MESGNKYDHLLIKYSLNECNVQEEKFVLGWLNETESNRLYFESLVDTLRLVWVKEDIAKINLELEWEYFQQLIKTEGSILLDKQDFIPKDHNQLANYSQSEKTGKRWMMVVSAVAACLIFFLFFAAGVFDVDSIKKPTIVTKKSGSNLPIGSLFAVIRHEKNTTEKTKTFDLPDGSTTDLFPGSELTYREPSEGKKREVLLLGRANFKVAKDKTRPFTVFSGDISVTAIGTRFMVMTMPLEKLIVVRLHEGKVVVKSANTSETARMKDVYLVPGQELVYDVIRGTGMVRAFALNKKAGKTIQKYGSLIDDPIIPRYGRKSWFMFNNQSLSEIFDLLAEMYNVKISYSKKELNKMYFIGTFDKSDSLEFILKEIATINDLSIIKDNNNYTIKKEVLKQ